MTVHLGFLQVEERKPRRSEDDMMAYSFSGSVKTGVLPCERTPSSDQSGE